MDFLASTHFHIFAWVVGILLFLVSAVMANETKGKKITHMIARLFYVLILVSGIALFIKGMDFGMGADYGIKFLLGLLTIVMMEMALVRAKKGKKVTTIWILFFIFFFATMFYGFKLPMGNKFF
ncbi:YisL family protein [Sporosarcina sp. UB5]